MLKAFTPACHDDISRAVIMVRSMRGGSDALECMNVKYKNVILHVNVGAWFQYLIRVFG